MKHRQFIVVVISVFISAGVFAQTPFVATYDTDPSGGTSPTSSFNQTQAGLQFDVVFTTDGDGGTLSYESLNGDNNSACINLNSGITDISTTELISIKRSDGAAFVLDSVFINNMGGQLVTVQGYSSNVAAGTAQTMVSSSAGRLYFGGITIDEIRINSSDFSNTYFDTFGGANPNNTPTITGNIPDISVIEGSSKTFINLKSSFDDVEDGASKLSYSIQSVDPVFFSTNINSGGQLTISYATTGIGGPIPVVIRATDSGGLYVEQSINVTVLPSSVVFDISGITSVAEGNTGITTVTFVITKTGTTNQTSTVDYSLSGTATSGIDFNNIGGTSGATSQSGTIIFAATQTSQTITLDVVGDELAEQDETLDITLSGATTAGSGTATIGTSEFTTTILNDDHVPVVDAGQNFKINENSSDQSVVGVVSAKDVDAATTLQKWDIVTNADPDGDGNVAFIIDPNTGVITVNDAGDLDRETTATISLDIVVSDGTNISKPETVLIALNDVNDVVPIVNSGQSFSIDENSSSGTSIGKLTAYDKDITPTSFQNWSIVQNSDVNNDGNVAFKIDPATAELFVNDALDLDREAIAAVTLLVTVDDGVNTSLAGKILINLNDINDVVPEIQTGSKVLYQ